MGIADITEWEFTAEVAGWINELLAGDPRLPFSRAKCEQRGPDSHQRRDLTLLDQNKRVVLTGEVKLPYRVDGGSPYHESVVQDARRKAQRAGAPFFFTWNVNECVLWETFPAKTLPKDRKYKSWDVTQVYKPSHFEVPSTLHRLKIWLPEFLNDFAKILRGTIALGTLSPDEKFIAALESFLKMPIRLNLEELDGKYREPPVRLLLDRWMRDEQGWVIHDDPEGVRDNLERAARFACYALVNKLVFYEALLRRYQMDMPCLEVPEHIATGEALRIHLESFFEKAKVATRDYETVFGEDPVAVGNRLPFYSDRAVPHWRALLGQIRNFDFSKLDYEVIGNIFERLIGPEERHKYGQFYTRVEVVDLINSFCLRDGREKLLDPACGGGTFLVRAYARKRELAPSRSHGQRLAELFGIDISLFATHLTTINLATRDLVDDENYPQIARSDFFDVVAGKTFLWLPDRLKAAGLGRSRHREIQIPQLDAVVGNPPYVRQEDLRKTAKKGKKKDEGPEPGTKEHYLALVKKESGADLSGRGDLHCYFWPHAASFLKEGGYLCFLTSGQWLDVEYGFRLQHWMLGNFEIVAVFESLDEPWFVGARVATAVTILRKQPDDDRRMSNVVRFVQLRRPIREILAHDGTTAGAVQAADAFRDEILSLAENTVNARYRARLVKQGDLWDDGVRLGRIMGKSQPGSDTYYGGKWGVYLRAPDLWFKLLDSYGTRFVPLGNIAEVRFGVKTGKDEFFFPKDCSAEGLAAHEDRRDFELAYGVSRKEVASGKVKLVRCGAGRGEVRPLEAKYLEPEVHSLMEVNGFTVSPGDCSRLILLVGEKRERLKGTYVLDYIEWGEKRGYHKGPTCAARVTDEREWYDLTGHQRGHLFWPKSQQYKHAIPFNENNLQCNCNLYDIHLPKGIDPQVMAGILNSSFVILSKFQYGRPVGVEGALKTEVVDVNMMLVPDPRGAAGAAREKVARAFGRLKQRQVLYFLSERRLRRMALTQAGKARELEKFSDQCELDLLDRRELDGAVLEMLGVTSKRRRDELIGALYQHLREFFEQVRQKEEKGIENKKAAKRRGAVLPARIAAGIFVEIQENHGGLLRRYNHHFLDWKQPFDTFEVPAEGRAEAAANMFAAHGVRFVKGRKELDFIKTKNPAQDPLLVLVAESGVRGLVQIPHEAKECQRLLAEYRRFVREREETIRGLIANRTADEEMQEKIYDAVMALVAGFR